MTFRAASPFALALALVVGLAAAMATLAYSLSFRWALDAVGDRGGRVLALAGATLENELERFAALPGALVQFDQIAEIDADRDLAPVSALLARVAAESGASDVFVLDIVGVAVASSDAGAAQSVLGARFGFHPFYFEALLLGRGGYHALDAVNAERSFYFSRVFRSRSDGRRYIMVVRIDAAPLDAAWRGRPGLSLVDANGVVFLSANPALLFTSAAPLSDRLRHDLERIRQYGRIDIVATPMAESTRVGAWSVWRLTDPGWARRGVAAAEALAIERPLASGAAGLEGFRFRDLVDVAEARRRAAGAALIAGLATLLVAGALWSLHLRHRDAMLRLRQEAQATAILEQRVAERTLALSETNARLEREAAERRAADAALDRAERDLNRARKLAALGRLSADISHELNQPLAAIRAYSENADAFLARGRVDAAAGNLKRIVTMVDRIARIIANLKTFARGEAPPPRPVRVSDALDDALQMCAGRLRDAGVTLEVAPGPALDAVVLAGRVRLQQVFTNLIANALEAKSDAMGDAMGEAMGEAPDRRVSIAAVFAEGSDGGGQGGGERSMVRVSVRDRGPGLDPEMMERAFDPFVTTKGLEDGPGLGLGLSIVYGVVTAAGGSVTADNHPEGGAVFTVTLRRADAETAAAVEAPPVEAPRRKIGA